MQPELPSHFANLLASSPDPQHSLELLLDTLCARWTQALEDLISAGWSESECLWAAAQVDPTTSANPTSVALAILDNHQTTGAPDNAVDLADKAQINPVVSERLHTLALAVASKIPISVSTNNSGNRPQL